MFCRGKGRWPKAHPGRYEFCRIGNHTLCQKSFLSSTLFLTIIFGFILSGFSQAFGKGTDITLIYSSNTLGELKSGCCLETGNVGAGGLAKRSHYIKTVREEAKNLFILDGGDALAKGPSGSEKEKKEARERAENISKIYQKMGYDAINIGDTDLVLGAEYLSTLSEKLKLPFLSANLKDKKTGEAIFKPYLVKVIDGLRVGIIGLLGQDIHRFIQAETKGYFVEDPVKVANETINRSLYNCDRVIALAHMNAAEIESLGQKIQRISIIIGGNDRTFLAPKPINRSIYVQTDAFGFHIGRLNLKLVKGSSGFVNVLPRTLIQRNIEEVRKKIEDPKYSEKITRLKEIEEVFLEQKRKLPKTENKSTYENFLIYLSSAMPSDPEIEKMISSI